MFSIFVRVCGPGRGTAKSLVGVTCVQNMSTASTELKPQRVSKNVSFRPATDSHVAQESRPIAIIYGWLVAKARHIHKYGDFYLGKGFDVLNVKVEPLQLAWPPRAQTVVQQVLDFVTDSQRTQQPILIHGFSVGAYLYGETLVKIMADPELRQQMAQRIQGQIIDSGVDYEGVPRGMSQAVTPNPVLQKILKTSLDSYLNMFPDKVVKHYHRSSAAFHANALKVPSLCLYSLSDPIGIASSQLTVMKKWRDCDIPVFEKCWEASPHVSHFSHHPVEYIGALNSFLHDIGLVDKEVLDRPSVTMNN